MLRFIVFSKLGFTLERQNPLFWGLFALVCHYNLIGDTAEAVDQFERHA
jgi:hypothetical protein